MDELLPRAIKPDRIKASLPLMLHQWSIQTLAQSESYSEISGEMDETSFAEKAEKTLSFEERVERSAEKSQPFGPEIAKENLQLYIAKLTEWQKDYPLMLKELRHQVKRYNDIETIQEKLTRGYQSILQRILQEAINLIGEPPCSYGWFGVGSYSRGEILPYSDVEYLFLFQDESITARQYFNVLNQIISLQIRCVNEYSGFHPDQYPEVTEIDTGEEKLTLPKTLEEIAEGIITHCRSGLGGNYTQVLSALQGRYIAGDESLWAVYENLIHEKIHSTFIQEQSDPLETRTPFKYTTLSEACRDILFIIVEGFEKTWQ
nr:hypothetical protein [Parachlamydiaceae bacterium]